MGRFVNLPVVNDVQFLCSFCTVLICVLCRVDVSILKASANYMVVFLNKMLKFVCCIYFVDSSALCP